MSGLETYRFVVIVRRTTFMRPNHLSTSSSTSLPLPPTVSGTLTSISALLDLSALPGSQVSTDRTVPHLLITYFRSTLHLRGFETEPDYPTFSSSGWFSFALHIAKEVVAFRIRIA